RSVDPEGVVRAADRAAELIAELSGGEVSRTLVDAYPRPIEPVTIGFRPERCDGLLGFAVCREEMRLYLEPLGLSVDRTDEDEWQVAVPPRRADLTLEADLV